MLVAAASAATAKASDTTSEWTGATDGNWGTTTNWSPTFVPGTTTVTTTDAGDTAVFDRFSLNTSINLGTSRGLSAIVFDKSAIPSYTLGTVGDGNVITFGTLHTTNHYEPSVFVGSSVLNSQTINSNFTFIQPTDFPAFENDSATAGLLLAGNGTLINGTSTGSIYFGGIGSIGLTGTLIGGSGTVNLIKEGAGTLVIGNTLTGIAGTVVNGLESLTASGNYATGVTNGVLSDGLDYTSSNPVIQLNGSTSNTPLGDGSFTLNSGAKLIIGGPATGGAGTAKVMTIAGAAGRGVALGGSTGTGNDTISLDHASWDSLSVTFGSSAFSRSGGQDLSVAVPTLSTLGVSNKLFIPGIGSFITATDTNATAFNFVTPYIIGRDSNGTASFLNYTAANGVAPLTSTQYTPVSTTPFSTATGPKVFTVDQNFSETITSGATDKLASMNVGSNTLTLSTSAAATGTLSNGSSTAMGLLFDGGTVTGSTVAITTGTGEVSLFTTANNGTISTGTFITGAGTKFGPGTLNFLAPVGTSAGTFAVNEGTLNIGGGGKLAGTNLFIDNGGVVNVASGGSLTLTGAMTVNSVNANVIIASGGTYADANATPTSGGINVLAGNVTINSSLFTNTGTMAIGPGTTEGYASINQNFYATVRVNSGASMGTGSVLVNTNGILSLASISQLSTGNLVLGSTTGSGTALGILETNGTFNRAYTTAATNGGFQMGVFGGFAARGGELDVTLTDTSGSSTTITPGANGVATNLNFGSPNADSRVLFQNTIVANFAAVNSAVILNVIDNLNSSTDYAEINTPITINATSANGFILQKTGNGLLYLSSPTALTNLVTAQVAQTPADTASLRFFDGVLRLANVSALPQSSSFTFGFNSAYLGGDDSLPIHARPILETNGLFQPNAAGLYKYSAITAAGFSAWGTSALGSANNNLTINFGGASGSIGFSGVPAGDSLPVITGGGTGGNNDLTLGSIYSNGTVIIKNPLDLTTGATDVARNRVFYVNQGVNPTQPEAELDGYLTEFASTAANVIKDGAGTLYMTNPTSSYTGSTSVYAGTLLLGGSTASGVNSLLGKSTTNVFLGNLNSTASASLINDGSFTMARNVTAQASTGALYLGGATAETSAFTGNVLLNRSVNLSAISGGTVNFNTGVISGVGGVAAVGAGNVNIGAAETYTGATGVLSGVLSLNAGAGSLANTAITVASAATFAPGAGTSAGVLGSGSASLSAKGGSTVNLADGTVGAFTLNGENAATALSLGSGGTGATIAFDLTSAGADLLTTTGVAAVSGLNVISISASPTLTQTTYTLIHATGGLSTGGTFAFDNAGDQTENSGSYVLTLNNDSTDETITVSAAPEPGSCALILGGAAAGMLKRRRRAAKI